MKKKIEGTNERPRLYVFRSNKHIYAQIIDDIHHRIIVSSSSIDKNIKTIITQKYTTTNCETCKIVGEDIANKAIKQGIKKVVFDRGQKLYHGKIKALADAARKQGMNF